VKVLEAKHRPACIFAFLVTLYLLLFYRLGLLGLVGPDEPRYAQVAKEMSRSCDWITPRLHDEPWFEKPILLYWLVALNFKAFGISELAARLPSALSALVGCLTVFEIGRRWISFRCGLFAGLILATSPLYFSLARAASFDMLLTALLTLSLASLFFCLLDSNSAGTIPGSRPRIPLAFYFCLALAVLAKGPVALALVGISVLSFLLLQRRYGFSLDLGFIRGCAVVTLVALPWYGVCYYQNGWPFLREFILEHNLARFATDQFQHVQPLWFYGPVLFFGFFPWFFQALLGILRLLRRSRDTIGRAESLLWIWSAVPILFFSFSQSKLPGYILPALPPLAVLAAREWDRVFWKQPGEKSDRQFRIGAVFQAGVVLGIGLSLPLFVHKLTLQVGSSFFPVTFSFCVIGAIACLMTYRGQWTALFSTYVAGGVLVVILILHTLIPLLDPVESMRELARTMRTIGYSGEPVYLYKLSRRVQYGLDYYLDTKSRIIYADRDLTYPSQGSLFLLSPSTVDVSSLLLSSGVSVDFRFHDQRIIKAERR